MLYSISGKVSFKSESFAVVDASGLGLKIFASKRTLNSLPQAGGEVKFFTSLYMRENALELYGFLTAEELNFFEMLNSVSGVGPKSALAVLDVAELEELSSVIKENRPDLLTRASGIGRKTAERIIVELKSKTLSAASAETVKRMESDADIVEVLSGLGYKREQAKDALQKVDRKSVSFDDRLKAALKILGGKSK